MKRRYLLSLMIISLPVMAETNLKFSGTLIADPCLVAIDSQEQTVEMGNIAARTFLHYPRSAPKLFTIVLTECDLSSDSAVTVTFNGKKDAEQPQTFAVTGSAQGIAIALEDEAGRAISPGTALAPAPLNAGETLMTYTAYVQGLDFTKVREGSFESTVIFTLEYQ